MDDSRFDDLVRTLVGGSSPRRNVIRLLAGSALGLLGWTGLDEAAAHDLLAKCKKFTGKKKKACVKKAKKHAAQHANEAPPASGGSNSPVGDNPTECMTPEDCPAPLQSQVCAQATCIDGECGIAPRIAGTECRTAAGVCDIPEVCDGTSLDCPPDRFRPSGFICRAPAGPCDVAETCTGTSPNCPNDVFAPLGTVCRQANGPCDVAEVCNGFSVTCPNNGFAPDDTTCGTNQDQVCCKGICCEPGSFCTGGGCCRTAGLCTGRTPCCFGCEPSDPTDPGSTQVCGPG